MAGERLYPPLSMIVPVDELPDELGFIKDGLTQIFDKIYYKNLRYTKSKTGEAAFYQLVIVSYQQLGFDLPGEITIAINPDFDGTGITEIPIVLNYEWKILGLISRFDPKSFMVDDAAALLKLVSDILNISLLDILTEAVNQFFDEENLIDSINLFVQDINTKYSPVSIPAIASTDPETALLEVLASIENVLDKSVLEVVFDVLIDVGSNIFENINHLFASKFSKPPIDYIKELLIPKIHASMDLGLGLIFPRSILIPLDENTKEPIVDVNVKSMLKFDAGTFVFSTEKGFYHEDDLVLNLNYPSQIGETGLIITLDNAKLDLSPNTNIIEADLDGRSVEFKGVFIEKASIELPKFWQKDDTTASTATIIGTNMLIGDPGGFSGTLAIQTDEAQQGDILHFTIPGALRIELNAFDITFHQNNVESSNIIGTIIIPGLKQPDGADAKIVMHVGINKKKYTIEATEFSPVELGGVVVDIETLVVTLDDGSLIDPTALAGKITFPALSDGSDANLPVPMSFGASISEDTYLITVSDVPALYLFGIGLELNDFSIKFNDSGIQEASLAGKLILPMLENSDGVPEEIDFGFELANDNYTISVASLPRLFLFGIGIQLDDFEINFDKTGLNSLGLEGDIYLPVFDNNSGEDVEVSFDLEITPELYSIGVSDVPTMYLFGIEFNLDDFTIEFTKTQLNDFVISGNLIFPVLQNEAGNPEPLSFSFEVVDSGYRIAVSDVPRLNILGLGLEIDDFEIAFDKSGLDVLNIDVQLYIPSLVDLNGDEAPISIGLNISESEYSISATDIPTFYLFGMEVNLNDFSITFDKTGINNFELSGNIIMPVLANEEGDLQPFEFSFSIEDNNYEIAISNVPTLYLFGLELNINDFQVSFDNTGLNNLGLDGNLIIPFLTNEDGNPSETGFTFAIDNSRYLIGVSELPTLNLYGLSLEINDFEIEFTNTGIESFDLEGTLGLPFLENEDGSAPSLDFSLELSETNYHLGVANISTLYVGGLEIELDDISVDFDKTGLNELVFSGRLAFPVLEDENGDKAWITFSLNMSEDLSVISASTNSIPPLYLGGLEISLTGISIAFNKDGLVADQTGISGIIKIPAFSVELEISIEFEKNGFAIEAKVPEGSDYVDVIDIEDMIQVQLGGLSIGKHNDDWSFGFAGRIINHISIPGVEKFVPSLIDIKQFNFTADNDVDLNLGMEWSNGFKIEDIGQGGSATFPVNLDFGNAVLIRAIEIGAKVDTKIDISVSLLGTQFNLGPITAVVEGLGFTTEIEKRNDGNLDPINVDLDIKYPTGIGLSIDTDVIRGGGYLFFDYDNNRYAGALELSFKDSFALSAIGLLTTRMPDGTKGTSLLIIISIEFPSPIVLGYNFYLSGVGGLIGIHRTAVSDKLREGVRTNAIDNILFPTNIIQNISQIVSDLRSIFPPKRDQFLIGPMALITWSIPPLIRIELGIIVEFDDPFKIAILGVIKVGIPTSEKALIKLQVNFIGIIDFEKCMLSFDASLYDSKIMIFTLEGDMALRLSWGQKKDFAISVGGFHPAYVIPAHLSMSNMKRLTISLMSGNPRLSLTSYFALTTNSVQFGASIDFCFKAWKIKVVGFFSFDVLFMFSPFQFMASVMAGLAVKWGSKTLFSIGLKFSLVGPSPWTAKGYAKFKVLFVTVKVNFSKTFGERRDSTLPDIYVFPLVLEEVNKPSNWKSELKESSFELVKLKELFTNGEDIIIHSHGSLTVTQGIVPLGINITNFGNSKPIGDTLFDITNVALVNNDGEQAQNTNYVRNDFIPASFKTMSDDDKLKTPSFENLKSGVKIIGYDHLDSDYCINREVDYEVIVSDYKNDPGISPESSTCNGVKQPGFITINSELYTHFSKGGIVASSHMSKRKKLKKMSHANKVSINKNEEYTLVNVENLSKYEGTEFSFGNRTEANEELERILNLHPQKEGEVIIASKLQMVE